ncbi:hypothetical protein DXG03_004855 [Asterophora parasitica]|uniref:Alternative oxidase n=1 Tax=Asterophora parasitica TaxID=117018 RepID=A0A9P7KGZ0_9AGAR|nr:hypothetical protein DXG03_004855 [Asterophora parasitica]
MFKTAIASTTPLQRRTLLCSRTVILVQPLLCRRSFMTSGARRDALTGKSAQSTSGGPHKRTSEIISKVINLLTRFTIEDLPKSSSHATALTQPDAVSTIPTMVRGDWVLFHPVYTQDELKAVEVLHHEAKTFSDKMSVAMVKFARVMFDFVSRYKHVKIPPNENMSIQELRAGGYLSDEPAPEIAIDYWRLPPDAKLLDVMYAVRSDETTHRFVNHSLANLDPSTDVNPFALREPDMHVKGKKIAFDRSEAEKYVKESHALMAKKTYMADEAIHSDKDSRFN